MSMVEAGLGISILSSLVLQRIPYRIVIKKLEMPAYRKIGIAMLIKGQCRSLLQDFLFFPHINYRPSPIYSFAPRHPAPFPLLHNRFLFACLAAADIVLQR